MADINRLIEHVKDFSYKEFNDTMPSTSWETFYPFNTVENIFNSLYMDYKIGHFFKPRMRIFGGMDPSQYRIVNGYDIASYYYKKDDSPIAYDVVASKVRATTINSIIIGAVLQTGKYDRTNIIANYKDLFRVFSMDPYDIIKLFKNYRQSAAQNVNYFIPSYSVNYIYPQDKFEKLYDRITSEAIMYCFALKYFQKAGKAQMNTDQLTFNQALIDILKSVNNGAAAHTMNNELVLDVGLNNEEFVMFGFKTTNPYMPSLSENVSYDEFVSKDFLKYINTKYSTEFERKELDTISYTISAIQKELMKNEKDYKDKNVIMADKWTVKTMKEIMQGKEFPKMEKLQEFGNTKDNLSTMKQYEEITPNLERLARKQEDVERAREERIEKFKKYKGYSRRW